MATATGTNVHTIADRNAEVKTDDNREGEESKLESNDDETAIPVPFRVCKLNIDGMTCSSCVSKIERALSKRSGVEGVSVSLVLMGAEVKYNPDTLQTTRQKSNKKKTTKKISDTTTPDADADADADDDAPSLAPKDAFAQWINNLGFRASVVSDAAVVSGEDAAENTIVQSRIQVCTGRTDRGSDVRCHVVHAGSGHFQMPSVFYVLAIPVVSVECGTSGFSPCSLVRELPPQTNGMEWNAPILHLCEGFQF